MTKTTLILANLVGCGAVAANDAWDVASGEARKIARYFLHIHALFFAAFTVSASQSRQR